MRPTRSSAGGVPITRASSVALSNALHAEGTDRSLLRPAAKSMRLDQPVPASMTGRITLPLCARATAMPPATIGPSQQREGAVPIRLRE